MLIFIFTLIGMVLFLGVIGTFALHYRGNYDNTDALLYIGSVTYSFAIFLCIVLLISIPFCLGAGEKAKVINNQYGTEYTAENMFWAGDLVEKIIRTENNVHDKNQRIELDIE